MTHKELKQLLEAVNEAWGGEYAEVEITKEIELPDNATLYLFSCGDCKASAVCYKDGTTFVLDDWQSSRPESFDEIKDYSWKTIDGKEVITFDGLPRIF